MNKQLKDLSELELKEVWTKNEKLQDDVLNDYQESEMFWVSETLEYFKKSLTNWSIGFDQNNFIKINDDFSFLESFQEPQESFEILDTEDKQRLEKAINEFNQSEETQDDMNELEEQVDYFQDKLMDYFNQATTTNYGYLESYFNEFYLDSRMDDSYFVNDDMVLFETIVKSYK